MRDAVLETCLARVEVRVRPCPLVPQGKEYAVKVYKTSIMVFKNRDKYVSGEYRYRHGYCRSNPRKMVKVAQPWTRCIVGRRRLQRQSYLGDAMI